MILGSPGAGKTTLARRLAAASGLPLWSMDELYWEPGWRRPDEAAVARRLADAVAGPAWIIEGNYERYLAPRLARADSAVFLDVGPVRCLIRIARRGWRRGGRVDWRFVRKVAGFSRRERPRMLSVLERWSSTGKQVIVL
ncbi:MAG TPA: hypothetical protein VH165_35595 [Kofleriaceae bacterium]|nr:hypothetical protein [Kofleriaceae bacterium]